MPPTDTVLTGGGGTSAPRAGAESPARGPDRWPILALLGANGISLAGNGLTGMAVPWFVLQTTGSAGQTGLVAAAGLVPVVLATAFGGALVDRLGFKRTSVLSDLASGATVAAIPLLYHTVGLPFAVLLALVFLGALLDAPGTTARGALLPDLAQVGGMPLERANGAAATIGALASLVAPPLAGVLIAAVGPSRVLWVDAATFAVSAAAVAALVPSPAPAAPTARGRYLDEVRAGWRFLGADRLLRAIGLTAAVANLLLAPVGSVVLPVYAERAFGDARDLGLIFGAFGAGLLAGAFAYSAVGPRLPRRGTLVAGYFLAGAPLWVLAAEPGVAVSAGAMAVVGLAIGPINPLAVTVMQERVPPELRGRVFGTVTSLVLVAAPLGVLVTGGLLEVVGVRAVLLGIAGAFLAVCVSLLVNPAFREMSPDDGPPPPPNVGGS